MAEQKSTARVLAGVGASVALVGLAVVLYRKAKGLAQGVTPSPSPSQGSPLPSPPGGEEGPAPSPSYAPPSVSVMPIRQGEYINGYIFSCQGGNPPVSTWSVTVFDPTGSLVWESGPLSGASVEWPGINRKGEKLGRGLYIGIIRFVQGGVPYESRHYLPLEPGRVFTFTASRGTGIRIRVYRSGLFWPVLVYEGEASGTTLSWGTQQPGTYYVYIYRREDSTWYPDSTAVVVVP